MKFPHRSLFCRQCGVELTTQNSHCLILSYIFDDVVPSNFYCDAHEPHEFNAEHCPVCRQRFMQELAKHQSA